MSVLSDLRKKITDATSSVTSQILTARRAIVSTREEIARLKKAPVPLVEIDARIDEIVAQRGAAWLEQHAGQLLRHHDRFGRGLAQADGRGPIEIPGTDERDVFGFLCAGNPTVARETLRALMRRLEFTPGPPAADRGRMLAALEARRRELEAREEELVEAVNTDGLTFAHRPEVLQRREQEARRRELEEKSVADRQRRQAEVDARHSEEGRDASPNLVGQIAADRAAYLT
jgi:hypothetical protein